MPSVWPGKTPLTSPPKRRKSSLSLEWHSFFLNELFRALGIALVVGALFSFGTFMAQWWDHAWQRQNVIVDRAFNSGYGDKRYAKLQRLAKEYLELYEKLEGLHDDVSGHDSIPVILNEDPAD